VKGPRIPWHSLVGPLSGVVVGALIALPAASLEIAAWNFLVSRVGVAATIIVLTVTVGLVGVMVSVVAGVLRIPGRELQLSVAYGIRIAPYLARDLVTGMKMGIGRGNSVYRSLPDFYRADRRRKKSDEYDFGVHWRDGNRGVSRVTWVKVTGEVIAVQGRKNKERVEVLATVASETDIERRLKNWAYACMYSKKSLRWARRRAVGWNVPLPPRGSLALETDQQPLKPWPAPPPPSMDEKEGMYVGTKADDDDRVWIVDSQGKRPLYHCVDSSPTGLSWGYSGAGPSDLARSLLYDRLGYCPHPAIQVRFRDDVVVELSDDFILPFWRVDAWVDDNRQLFAEYPHGEPFDPYASGGAYD
jgi:hypothetical protein